MAGKTVALTYMQNGKCSCRWRMCIEECWFWNIDMVTTGRNALTVVNTADTRINVHYDKKWVLKIMFYFIRESPAPIVINSFTASRQGRLQKDTRCSRLVESRQRTTPTDTTGRSLLQQSWWEWSRRLLFLVYLLTFYILPILYTFTVRQRHPCNTLATSANTTEKPPLLSGAITVDIRSPRCNNCACRSKGSQH